MKNFEQLRYLLYEDNIFTQDELVVEQKRMILDALRKVDIILYDLHACCFFSFLNV